MDDRAAPQSGKGVGWEGGGWGGEDREGRHLISRVTSVVVDGVLYVYNMPVYDVFIRINRVAAPAI